MPVPCTYIVSSFLPSFLPSLQKQEETRKRKRNNPPKSASYDSFPTKLLSSEQKEGVRVKRVSNDKPASFLPLPHQFTEHPEEAKEKESNRSNYNAQRISP